MEMFVTRIGDDPMATAPRTPDPSTERALAIDPARRGVPERSSGTGRAAAGRGGARAGARADGG